MITKLGLMVKRRVPKFRYLAPFVAAAAMVPLVPAVAAAEGLDWKLCASVAKEWDAATPMSR